MWIWLLAIGQGIRHGHLPVDPALVTAVAGLVGRVMARPGFGKRILALLVDVGDDRLMQGLLIAFQRQDIVRLLVNDLLGNGLGVSRGRQPGYRPDRPGRHGRDRPRIFRILAFSSMMGYPTGRLELYAAQRPARYGDFFSSSLIARVQ